jgi:glycine/D-amino acid oxidase-like deaminating enzyme
MTEIRIIGGGILGATLAWELAREGATVEVVDAGVTQRASAGSLAWLNVSSTRDPGYARLRAASLRLWHDLKAAWPEAPVAFPGAMLWGVMGDLDDHAAHLAQVGWQAEVLDAKGVRALAPERALFAAAEGYADPRAITDWMRARAEAAGARFAQGEATLAALEGPTVVTAGPLAGALLAQAGIALPLNRSPGILMRTAPAPRAIPFPLATPKLDLWQGTDGALFMSSALHKTPERADDLMMGDALAELARICPALSGAEVAQVTRRDRPIPEDGFPVIGGAGRPDLWLAATHSGMTLAPVIAQALADEILGRAPRHDLSRWALSRDFATPEAALA